MEIELIISEDQNTVNAQIHGHNYTLEFVENPEANMCCLLCGLAFVLDNKQCSEFPCAPTRRKNYKNGYLQIQDSCDNHEFGNLFESSTIKITQK